MIEFLKAEESDISHNTLIIRGSQNLPKITDFEEFRQKWERLRDAKLS